MKLAREQVPFLRLGRASGVHPAVRSWLPGGERYPHKNTREWARLAEAVPVVSATLERRSPHFMCCADVFEGGGSGSPLAACSQACVPRLTHRALLPSPSPAQFGATCFGVNHALLKDKLFDVCIIDEAGQVGGAQGLTKEAGRL